MSLTKDEPVTSEFKLEDRSDWPEWYSDFKWHATGRGVWHLIDPEGEDAPNYVNKPPPEHPSVQQLCDDLNAARSLARANWRSARDASQASETPISSSTQSTQQEPEPTSDLATFADVKDEYNARVNDYNSALKNWNIHAIRYQQMFSWVNASVARDLLRPTKVALLRVSEEVSLQDIVRELKKQLAPTDTSSKGTARKAYRAALKKASQGRINQSTWYKEWRSSPSLSRL